MLNKAGRVSFWGRWTQPSRRARSMSSSPAVRCLEAERSIPTVHISGRARPPAPGTRRGRWRHRRGAQGTGAARPRDRAGARGLQLARGDRLGDALGDGLQAADAKAPGGLPERLEAALEALAQERRVDLGGVDARIARQAPLRLEAQPAPARGAGALGALVIEPGQGAPGTALYKDALHTALGAVGGELAGAGGGGGAGRLAAGAALGEDEAGLIEPADPVAADGVGKKPGAVSLLGGRRRHRPRQRRVASPRSQSARSSRSPGGRGGAEGGAKSLGGRRAIAGVRDWGLGFAPPGRSGDLAPVAGSTSGDLAARGCRRVAIRGRRATRRWWRGPQQRHSLPVERRAFGLCQHVGGKADTVQADCHSRRIQRRILRPLSQPPAARNSI